MTMKNLTTLTIYFSRLVLAFARERQFYRSNQRVDRRPYNPERREAQITPAHLRPPLCSSDPFPCLRTDWNS